MFILFYLNLVIYVLLLFSFKTLNWVHFYKKFFLYFFWTQNLYKVWIPLFKKKSYFLYFITFNNWTKYWYDMLYMLCYYVFKKKINLQLNWKKKIKVFQNICIVYSYIYNFILLLCYLVHFVNLKDTFFPSVYTYLNLLTEFFFSHRSVTLNCYKHEFRLKKALFFLKWRNIWKKKRFRFKRKIFWIKQCYTMQKQVSQYNYLYAYIFKNKFAYLFRKTFIFFKKYKYFFGKKKKSFFTKFLVFSLIYFFKNFLKKKFYFFFTRRCIFVSFLKRKFLIFFRWNRKYVKVLKKYFCKIFFYIFIFIFIYKNLLPTTTLFQQLIDLVNLKKQRVMYYFLRYNILYIFQKLYKKFNIIGLQLIVKGKYATFAGGRKKKFICRYNNYSSTNCSYNLKMLSTQTSSKLGAAQFKFYLIYK